MKSFWKNKLNHSRSSAFRTRSLRIEPLEERRLLTVTTKQVNGDLFISSNGDSDHIAIVQASANLAVLGAFGTSVSGDGAPLLVPSTAGGRLFTTGQFQHIFVSLGDGDDIVEFAGLSAASVFTLAIDTGDSNGGDIVSFSDTTFVDNELFPGGGNSIGETLSITSGSGSDVINVNDVTAPTMSIKTGAGNDTINLGDTGAVTISGNASIDAGEGFNQILVGTGVQGEVTAEATSTEVGDGNDQIDVNTGGQVSVGGLLSIFTGADADTIDLNQLTAKNLVVNSGDGGDTVTLADAGNVSVTQNASITTGDSSAVIADPINIGSANFGVTIGGNLALSMGPGDNSLTIDNATIGTAGSSNTLTITTQGADSIDIGGAALVTVNGDTSINTGDGSDSVTVGAGAAVLFNGDAAITMHSGDADVDTVAFGASGNVGSSVSGDLTITTGTGADNINLANASAANLYIHAGDGDNTVDVAVDADVNVAGNASIDTGNPTPVVDDGGDDNGGDNQDDPIHLGSANGNLTVDGNLAISMGTGDNSLVIDHLAVGTTGDDNTLTITTRGTDSISFGGAAFVVVNGNTSVNTGAGADSVTIANNVQVQFHGDLSIDMASGDGDVDTVAIGSATTGSTVTGDLTINTGSGADLITLDNSTAHNLFIHAGDGDNTVSLAGIAPVGVTGSVEIDSGNPTETEMLEKAPADPIHIGSAAASITIGGDLSVKMGTGANQLTIDNATIGSASGNNTLDITTQGTDSITIGGAAAVTVNGVSNITTGDLSDILTIASEGAVTFNGDVSIVMTGATGDVDTVNISGDEDGAATVTGDLSITTGAGGDSVDIENTTANNLFVHGGDGDNSIVLASAAAVSVTQNLEIDTGDVGQSNEELDDPIHIGSADAAVTVGGSVSITMGVGDDTVTIDNLTAGTAGSGNTVNITTDGDDTVSLGDAAADTINGDLNIDTGAGSDNVTLGGAFGVTVHGNATIQSASDGNSGEVDTISVAGGAAVAVDGILSISTGSGADSVTLGAGGAISVSDIKIATGDRADVVTVDNVSGRSIDIDSGATEGGGDTVHIGSNNVITLDRGLTIETGDGNDLITVDDLTARNVSINSGEASSGGDTIEIGDFGKFTGVSIDEALAVNSGEGADIIDVNNLTAGYVSLNAGNYIGESNESHTDTVLVGQNGQVQIELGLAIVTGDGDDVVRVDDIPDIANISINTGTATIGDSVTIGALKALRATGGVSIETGNGADTVNVDFANFGSLGINTEDGNDTVNIGANAYVIAVHGMVIDGGEGDDAINVDRFGSYSMALEGGEGNNTIAIGNIDSPFTQVTGLISIHAGSGNDTFHMDRVYSGGDVVISLGGGANNVAIGAQGAESSAGSFIISGGSGVDTVKLQQVYMVGNLVVNAGAGNDNIDVEGSSALGTIVMNGNDGDDLITLNDVTGAGAISVSLGEGNNTLKFLSSSASQAALISAGSGNDDIIFNADFFNTNLNLDAGAGNNTIQSNGTIIANDASILTGGGSDSLQIQNDSAKILLLDLGAGNDTFGVLGSVVDHLFAEMGTGNDKVFASNSTVTDYSLLDGGAGTDSLTVSNDSGPKVGAVNFESVS